MALSDPSHAEEKKGKPTKPGLRSCVILKTQTRLVTKAHRDSKKMSGFLPESVHSFLSLSPTAPRPLLLPGMLSPLLWLVSNASEEGKN